MFTRPADKFAARRQSARPCAGEFWTPWGYGAVIVLAGRLTQVELPPVELASLGPTDGEGHAEDQEALGRWVSSLESYFRGEWPSWRSEDIRSNLDEMTVFARRTVEALMSVPAGSTVSYGELAQLAGYPRAARAVGSVMAGNTIPIVVPCHRVIRSDGSLGRYGTDATWKPRLLEHERLGNRSAEERYG